MEDRASELRSIRIQLYEKSNNTLGKTSEFTVEDIDESLQNILKFTLKDVQQLADDIDDFKCFSGNISGDCIDLRCKPSEVTYITDCWEENKLPSLIVLKESVNESSLSPDVRSNRTLSTYLRGMIGEIPDPSPLPQGDHKFKTDENYSYATCSNSSAKKYFKTVRSTSIRNETTFISYIDAPIQEEGVCLNGSLTRNDLQRGIKEECHTLPRQLSEISPSKRKGTGKGKPSRGRVSVPIITNVIDQVKDIVADNSGTTLPNPSYSLFTVTKILIEPEESPCFEVECREYETVGALKGLVQLEMKRRSFVLSDEASVDTSEISLAYEIHGTVYELYNDRQLMYPQYKTALYEHWKNRNATTPVKLALKETNWEIPTLRRISKLTGVVLDEDVAMSFKEDSSHHHLCIAKNDRNEVEWAQRTLHSYVDKVVRERNSEDYSLSMEIETGEAPMLLALQLPLDNKIEITFHYKRMFTFTKRINVNQYASAVLKDVFNCVVVCDLVEDVLENYTLQMTGEQSYLNGNYELISFADIRRCILKSEPIHLSVSRKPTPMEDAISMVNWLPIDPYSTQPPLHTDISRKQKNDNTHEVFAASVWDHDEEFALLISQIDNLPVPTSKDGKNLRLNVIVSLYHANQELTDKIRTKGYLVNQTGSIECNETILFGTQIKNLPKAAKILVCIQDEPTRKESSTKKRQFNIFYWGLVPVFDHRGILQSGPYTSSLWKGPTATTKFNYGNSVSYDKNPCVPCNNNPDPYAVQITFHFPRYTYPVFFPSSAPETCSFLLNQEGSSNSVRKQFNKLQLCLSQGQLPMSAFPSYIARIDWGKLSQVIEVYLLLQQIEAKQNLPMETALKLLDSDFADENVRAFAVRVLETLPNQQLENFLLQLTQALKFEPCHDSALARLLLKRALTHKRIGHFFFWYLKCELYNPLFTPRFGVLLEAYLKGCGEAMLRRFESQVEMQSQLENIGKEVEELGCNDASKMQLILQERLCFHDIPEKQLTPVYNPRICLGQLNPKKCKIMTSKKKPQWLEMCNVDPSALQATPTRLIVKLGDDMRQDVIVLRMLSLFNKIWEKEGLPDLCLIPYGCMATGPNSGFIEVVKSARTIADVSGINDNKKLYEWIKSYQKNEFGEDDADLLKEAVKRFTHSCAGYTVASYVLGIGDRHNDNIMITTSGNLFHIDFGHFLGNIKHFLGLKREWVPFVLTPDFVYVMGGENSETFNVYKNLCCRAFLCLRRHDELIFNLFSLMRSTGIPELACVEDANYIRNALMVTKGEHEAELAFRQLIKKCLDLQWTVQIMWWIHKQRTGGNSS